MQAGAPSHTGGGGPATLQQAVILLGLGAALMLAAAAPDRPGGRSPRGRAEAVAGAIDVEVQAALRTLHPIAARLRTGEPVDWRQFARLTEDPAGGHLRLGDEAAGGRSGAAGAGGQASVGAARLLAWVPRVSAAARTAYESHTGDDGYRSFRLVEPDPQARLVPAGPRPAHYPIHLAVPVTDSSRLLGLDLAAHPALTAFLAGAPGSEPSGGRTVTEQPQLVGPLALGASGASGGCPPALGPSGCEAALVVLLPVSASRRGGVEPLGYLIATIPWADIQAASLHRAGLTRAEGPRAAEAVIRPADPRTLSRLAGDPASRDLLVPSTPRAAFHVGDRLWTVDLHLPGLADRQTSRWLRRGQGPPLRPPAAAPAPGR